MAKSNIIYNLNDSVNIEKFEKFLESHSHSCHIIGFPSERGSEFIVGVYHIEPPGVTLTYVRSKSAITTFGAPFPAKLNSVGMTVALAGEENKIKKLEEKINDLLEIKDKPELTEISTIGDIHLGSAYPKPNREK